MTEAETATLATPATHLPADRRSTSLHTRGSRIARSLLFLPSTVKS